MWFTVSVLVGIAGLSACGTNDPPATATPPVPRGQTVFARYCNTCHPGGGLGAGPSLLIVSLTDAEVTDIVRHGKNRMPGFGERIISNDELADLLTYLEQMRQ